MIKEIKYKNIKPGYYISEYGDIYNSEGEKLSLYVNPKGYKMYNFPRINAPRSSIEIQVLVAHMFIGEKPDPDLTVNHKDCNPLNNHYFNLEYRTYKGNSEHARENFRYEVLEERYNASLTNDEVHYICEMLERKVSYDDILKEISTLTRDVLIKIKNGENYREISRHYKIDRRRITKYPYELKENITFLIMRGYKMGDIRRALNLDKSYNDLIKKCRKKYAEGSTTIEMEFIFTE